jgi:hypothetical protein
MFFHPPCQGEQHLSGISIYDTIFHMRPKDTIQDFNAFLAARNVRFTAIAIGGSALAILGVISRETRDFDILDPQIPQNIQSIAIEFALEQTRKGSVLREDWLNNGPASLVPTLPPGWRARLVQLFAGDGLELTTLGRSDFLCTKLFALCDRGTDFQDCLALKPTKEELISCLEWVRNQDENADWPKHVTTMFKTVAKELGYGL